MALKRRFAKLESQQRMRHIQTGRCAPIEFQLQHMPSDSLWPIGVAAMVLSLVLASILVNIANSQLVKHRFPLQSVWPMPKSMKTEAAAPVYFGGDFDVECEGHCQDPIPDAITRFKNNLFVNGTPSAVPSPSLSRCYINVTSSMPLALGVDEGYSLDLTADMCQIHAATQWGALHSLEVLSQLIFWTPEENTYSVRNGSVSIDDEPRFEWRGLMLDTARHYLEPKAIERTIMAMAANRMNTLHLHVVE